MNCKFCSILKKSCPTFKVGKYEGIIETYKKKMEEMGDLKRQIKYLEEKNSEYINVRNLLIKVTKYDYYFHP